MRPLWIGMGVLAGCSLLIAGCSDRREAHATEPSTEEAPLPEAPVPSHYWADEEDGEYRYAVAPSDEDRQAGRIAKSFFRVRYLGTAQGKYRMAGLAPTGNVLITCKGPCSVVTIQPAVVYGYGAPPQDVMPVTPGSVMWEAVSDMLAGELAVSDYKGDGRFALAKKQPLKPSTQEALNVQQVSPGTEATDRRRWERPTDLVGRLYAAQFDNCCIKGQSTRATYVGIKLDRQIGIDAENGDPEIPSTDVVQLGLQAVNASDLGRPVKVHCKNLWYGATQHYALPVLCDGPTIKTK